MLETVPPSQSKCLYFRVGALRSNRQALPPKLATDREHLHWCDCRAGRWRTEDLIVTVLDTQGRNFLRMVGPHVCLRHPAAVVLERPCNLLPIHSSIEAISGALSAETLEQRSEVGVREGVALLPGLARRPEQQGCGRWVPAQHLCQAGGAPCEAGVDGDAVAGQLHRRPNYLREAELPVLLDSQPQPGQRPWHAARAPTVQPERV